MRSAAELTMSPHAPLSLRPGDVTDLDAMIAPVGFADRAAARTRIDRLCDPPGGDTDDGSPDGDRCRTSVRAALPMLLAALADAASPDASLVNFERYVRAHPDRAALFDYLAANPRAVEILVRLFVGSQFLTEILLKNPDYLERLTEHRRLPEFKTRADFLFEALAAASGKAGASQRPGLTEWTHQLDELRRYQQWELLRIGACDAFGLFDLRSVTAQLSLLADAFVQACLNLIARELGLDTGDRPAHGPPGFCVLAFGKLGGEELNYSSDIDLVFLADRDATRFWTLGQRLIKALTAHTGEGFLYRVDMRLRPWGKSGALVNTVDAHLNYLAKHGRAWERQALLKARPIAGDFAVGDDFLRRAEPLVFATDPAAVRADVRAMKGRIEAGLKTAGREWGQVKSGAGSIRDIEFTTQCLQLTHGAEEPGVRSTGTLDGLARLADRGFLWADEYRQLTAGYNFLRTVEHALQLMHHKQVHALPENPREQAYLARRLDFPDAGQFLSHYERHCRTVRRVFDKYVGTRAEHTAAERVAASGGCPASVDPHLARMGPAYREAYGPDEIARHAALLDTLSADRPAAVRTDPVPEPADVGRSDGGESGADARGAVRLTIAGFDRPGDLSVICGLLFARGYDVVRGDVFCEVAAGGATPSYEGEPAVVAVLDLRAVAEPGRRHAPASEAFPTDDFTAELTELLGVLRADGVKAARGRLARRVAAAVRPREAAGTPANAAASAVRRLDGTDPSPAAGDHADRDHAVEADGTGAVTVEVDTVELGNAARDRVTVLRVGGADAPGFLYELTGALGLFRYDVKRLFIRTRGRRVSDVLHITDAAGGPVADPRAVRELRAAVGLVRHFTHLLPRSPDPERALTHFGEFLAELFRRGDWLADVADLRRAGVLDALARMLGVSDFLWQDYLRLQHENLFPVLADVESLAEPKPKARLAAELDDELAAARRGAADRNAADGVKAALNAFKDREMFRSDMRHILGESADFGAFSGELTDIAETVVAAALRLAFDELAARYGTPRLAGGGDAGRPGRSEASGTLPRSDAPCPLAVCALGKCGGRELGYASDIELMFLFAGEGYTAGGPKSVRNLEFFERLVDRFRDLIEHRREGIFQLDLRLRPYGRAGSQAVRLDTFDAYFAAGGPAWPYERQALVKLRPIAGDDRFGRRVEEHRDRLLYTGVPFDRTALRAMREKQLRQLVKAGTVNAKLSPGGLVDVEYLVQVLQIDHGSDDPALRTPNTLSALSALADRGLVTPAEFESLGDAYRFLRRLIDALRVVRGHAKDLTVPPPGTEEFAFLARRLGDGDADALAAALDRHTAAVQRIVGDRLGE